MAVKLGRQNVLHSQPWQSTDLLGAFVALHDATCDLCNLLVNSGLIFSLPGNYMAALHGSSSLAMLLSFQFSPLYVDGFIKEACK